MKTAFAFYDYLNNYSDRFLEEHDYSREEIIDGLRALAVRQGVGELFDTMLALEK